MRHDTSSAPRRALLAALVVAGGVAACDGSNAFGPAGFAPSIVELEAPASVPAGSTLEVFARSVAAVRLDSMVVVVEGGSYSARQRVEGQPRQVDLAGDFSFNLPAVVTDTIFTVTAFAFDAQGNVSLPAQRIVRVQDTSLPAVGLVASPTTVNQGGTVSLAVTAGDNLGLRRIGVEVRGPNGARVFADSLNTSGAQSTSTFTWQVPQAPVFGAYTATAFAVDVSNNRSTTAATSIRVEFVDVVAPTVAIEAPAAGTRYVTGDSLIVRARAGDNDRLAALRFRAVSLLGDPALGTDEEVARFTPVERLFDGTTADTTLTRVLRFNAASMTQRPPLLPEESVAIIVEAEDAAGFIRADTLFVTLEHDVVAPSVEILGPVENAEVNAEQPLGVTLVVADDAGPIRTGVNFITIEAQAITGNAATGGVTVQALTPPVNFTLQDLGRSTSIVSPFTLTHVLELSSTPNSPDRFFFLIVTARDVAGNVAADTIRLRDTSTP